MRPDQALESFGEARLDLLALHAAERPGEGDLTPYHHAYRRMERALAALAAGDPSKISREHWPRLWEVIGQGLILFDFQHNVPRTLMERAPMEAEQFLALFQQYGQTEPQLPWIVARYRIKNRPWTEAERERDKLVDALERWPGADPDWAERVREVSETSSLVAVLESVQQEVARAEDEVEWPLEPITSRREARRIDGLEP